MTYSPKPSTTLPSYKTKKTGFTTSVKTAGAAIDLQKWVALYVREVIRIEGYSLAPKDASSIPPLEEVG